jgi:gliding motility-associated-like protein
MFRYLSHILFVLTFQAFSISPSQLPFNEAPKSDKTIGFTQNKGQISDYNYKTKEDILYSGTINDLSYYLKNSGVIYQLYKVESWKKVEGVKDFVSLNKIRPEPEFTTPDQLSIWRIDIDWINCNLHAKKTEEKPLSGYDNYFFESCPDGALKVKTFEQIIFKSIYNGIDLKWYQKDGNLKYDYLLEAGSDYKQIQLEIKGANKILINEHGELIISTGIGEIIEQAPVVIQNEKELKAKWIFKNNIVSFFIENINPNQPFIIDPGIRTWGTYYGGNQKEYGVSCTTDNINNVFFAGSANNYTSSIIATPGAFQVSSPSYSSFLTKFNSTGQRIWGTYYAGAAGTFNQHSCSVDQNGNVFLVGATTLTSNISTPNSHQTAYGGGGADAFIVKFDPSGGRLWGSYIGGTLDDRAYSSCIDLLGNVYVAGFSNSTTNIASAGCHQSAFAGGTYDAFLIKFNSNGQRQWGTYYGGYEAEWGYGCSTDLLGNIYLTGVTRTEIGGIIATSGTHQSAIGSINNEDVFLVKFNSAGQRIWGTYYGGAGIETGSSCAIDSLGNIFVFGITSTHTGTAIATPGSHQPTFGGGGLDAFLAKFDQNGVRHWGTYYGGFAWDVGWHCATDRIGNVYITGSSNTNTGTAIATPGTQQPNCSGYEDIFLTCFGPTGLRHWGTYYGGPGHDNGSACAVDQNGSVYISAITDQDMNNTLATTGSHQSTYGGSADAVFAQFDNCLVTAPSNITPTANLNICVNTSATLSAIGSGTIQWFSSINSTSVLATGSVFTTPSLNVGTYTYYIGTSIPCGQSYERTSVTLIVSNVLPIIQATASQTLICEGQIINLNATGANSYSWSPGGVGSSVFNAPIATTNFSVIGTSTNGCKNTATILVSVNPKPIVGISTGTSPLCSGQSLTVNAIGANSYTWYPNGTISTSISIIPFTNTNYTIIGQDLNGCKDTLDAFIPITPTPTLNVTPFFYLCSGLAPLFANGAETFTWLPGNLTGSSVNVSPPSTTQYTIIGANKNCTSTAVSIVSLGIATPFNITASSNSGCQGTCFSISYNSNLFEPYAYYWDYPSDTLSTLNYHCYKISGTYQIRAQAIYTSGCHVSSNDTLNVLVFPLPVPNFTVYDQASLNINTAIVFQNLSLGADKFKWSFGDSIFETSFSTMNIMHEYKNAGNYCIKLTAIDTTTQCSDSLTKCVDILCPGKISIPNIFTPNNDGVNDVFKYTTSCIKSLKCTIYNRWSKELYSWEGIDGFWDGKTEINSPASDGTYFYILEYIEENNTLVRKSGSIQLSR